MTEKELSELNLCARGCALANMELGKKIAETCIDAKDTDAYDDLVVGFIAVATNLAIYGVKNGMNSKCIERIALMGKIMGVDDVIVPKSEEEGEEE